jgi:hypothetical protein
VINVTVASEAANDARRTRWTAKRVRLRRLCSLDRVSLDRGSFDSGCLGPAGDGEREALVTGRPSAERVVMVAYSMGRVAMPRGSRPASTQPMRVAATGITMRMRNRLFQGT